MNEIKPPERILDGYQVLRFLGRGGFGEVWLCRSEAMGDYHAIKFIAAASPELLAKEFQALTHYRKAAAKLRTPHLVPIEHINQNEEGLFYVMPLADGFAAQDPSDPAWHPLSLSAKIHAQSAMPQWFTSREITALLLPILQALQTLSEAGLVHRDVKPENILFFNGEPCLGDVSLVGEDAAVITRRGTPGYATPSWYVGGHPDMYGIAAMLYTLLTGNMPDKMGRSAFLWPPQGEASLSAVERAEWKRLHAVIRRATDAKVAERYVDFRAMAEAVAGNTNLGKTRLPMVVVSLLTLVATVAGTMVVAFRAKTSPADSPGKSIEPVKPAANPELVELTKDEKADYIALAGMVEGYMGDKKFELALMSVDKLTSTYPQARIQPGYSVARAMALKGLGRIDEAKQELRKEVNTAPSLSAMDARKQMWEDFGDLASAEEDVTRVLKKSGPMIFGLMLRADIRAQRGNFAGVETDRVEAYAMRPDNPDQKAVVDGMWADIERKYSGYAQYMKSLAPPPATPASTGSEVAPPDAVTPETPAAPLARKRVAAAYTLEDAVHDGNVAAFMDVVNSPGMGLKWRDDCGNTFLHLAVESPEIVDALLKLKPDLEAANMADCHPLHVAIKLGAVKTVKALLKAGADANARGNTLPAGKVKQGETTLICVAWVSDPVRMQEIAGLVLGRAPELLDARASMGYTALMHAADRGNLAFAKWLLENKADKSLKSEDGKTALDCAKGRLALIKEGGDTPTSDDLSMVGLLTL